MTSTNTPPGAVYEAAETCQLLGPPTAQWLPVRYLVHVMHADRIVSLGRLPLLSLQLENLHCTRPRERVAEHMKVSRMQIIGPGSSVQ